MTGLACNRGAPPQRRERAARARGQSPLAFAHAGG